LATVIGRGFRLKARIRHPRAVRQIELTFRIL
jgi:hypothetical protein